MSSKIDSSSSPAATINKHVSIIVTQHKTHLGTRTTQQSVRKRKINIGSAFSKALGCPFVDVDDLHPQTIKSSRRQTQIAPMAREIAQKSPQSFREQLAGWYSGVVACQRSRNEHEKGKEKLTPWDAERRWFTLQLGPAGLMRRVSRRDVSNELVGKSVTGGRKDRSRNASLGGESLGDTRPSHPSVGRKFVFGSIKEKSASAMEYWTGGVLDRSIRKIQGCTNTFGTSSYAVQPGLHVRQVVSPTRATVLAFFHIRASSRPRVRDILLPDASISTEVMAPNPMGSSSSHPQQFVALGHPHHRARRETPTPLVTVLRVPMGPAITNLASLAPIIAANLGPPAASTAMRVSRGGGCPDREPAPAARGEKRCQYATPHSGAQADPRSNKSPERRRTKTNPRGADAKDEVRQMRARDTWTRGHRHTARGPATPA
ncbi:hypothetical protein BJY52DRAFT_1231044 [Lactarius psammicola]|nr:hypothetical protein BJY52DRAFT_1231044 [Lactarius psammicola]